MARKRGRPPGGRCPITREQWDEMLAAYRERPTIKSVMEAGNCGKRAARRAIQEGWPDHGLPPFIEMKGEALAVHKEMATFRETWQEAAITKGEAARQAAEEAMAARISMDAALRAAKLNMALTEAVISRIEECPEAVVPEDITPKTIYQLTRALESANNVVEKAMKIAQMQAGKPESVLGVEIGILLERCNDDELQLVADTGSLPDRIVEQRRNVTAQLAMTAETDAEAVALTEGEDDQAENNSQSEAEESEPEAAAG